MLDLDFGAGPFVDGESYEGSNGKLYDYAAGCFLLPPPIDIDTVDGYSRQGVSDGTALDSAGNPIPAGAPIITWFGDDGSVLNSKDCTELDNYGVRVVATSASIDSAGNSYGAGATLIELPDGSVFCQDKTPGSKLVFADSDGFDDVGNAVVAGDSLIQLSSGDLVCAQKVIDTDTVDGFSVEGVSDGTALDRAGNPIPAGAPIITWFDVDGNVINSKDFTPVSVTGDGVDNTDPANPVITQTTIRDNSDNTATIQDFDQSKPPCVVIKASAFSIDPVTGNCILTLPAKVGIDISALSVEVVLVEDNSNGTGDVTGTNDVTCTFLKTPKAWSPADPNDPASWITDANNPQDVFSIVKDGGSVCGLILSGDVCTVPKESTSDSVTANRLSLVLDLPVDSSVPNYTILDTSTYLTASLTNTSTRDMEVMYVFMPPSFYTFRCRGFAVGAQHLAYIDGVRESVSPDRMDNVFWFPVGDYTLYNQKTPPSFSFCKTLAAGATTTARMDVQLQMLDSTDLLASGTLRSWEGGSLTIFGSTK